MQDDHSKIKNLKKKSKNNQINLSSQYIKINIPKKLQIKKVIHMYNI